LLGATTDNIPELEGDAFYKPTSGEVNTK
jgi:hypothetical protein